MIAYTGEVPDPETIDRIFKPTILMLDGYVERTRLRKETERTQNEFFGMISHELRTPLTSIIGYADLLAELERDSMSERAQQFVEVISRNAHRELRLVQDLLLLVRLEAGTFSLERDVGDLRAIVEQSCEAVRPQAGRGDIGLDVSLADTGEIWGDAHRLGQAVDNLLTNAVKFSEPGDVVHVRLEADGEHASIEVEDEGIGVAEEEVDKLFDRLFRASSAVSNQIQGTGLGLTIVKSVIEAHGGKVSVRSRSGEGTCFRIELPLTRPPQPSAPEPVSGSGAANGNGGANGNGARTGERRRQARGARRMSSAVSTATILVADDDPDILELVKLRLELSGHPTLGARDGAEALELIQLHLPALCILDVQMPRMSGFEVLHRMRADDATRGIPVILLTASVQDQDVIMGLESGADDYLRKPFTPIDLQTRVAALINGR